MESPQALVREIYEQHDLSETQIVAELAELGVKTSQSTINRIRRGIGADARKGELALLESLLRLREKLRRSAPSTIAPHESQGAATA